jgi:transcriptional regulator with XRE-family HTH domain
MDTHHGNTQIMRLDSILERIDQRLTAVNLSASAASEQAGLSRDAIRNMQRALRKGNSTGNVTAHTITALSQVLECSPGWLLAGEGAAERQVAADARSDAMTLPGEIDRDAYAEALKMAAEHERSVFKCKLTIEDKAFVVRELYLDILEARHQDTTG